MLVEPLLHVVILTLIFGYLRQRSVGGIDVPVFIVTGIVPFLLFKNIAMQVMDGVAANQALFSFKQIKPIDTFVARTLLDAVLSAVVSAILLTGMAWTGMSVPFRDPLTVLGVCLVLIAMGLGLGMIFCMFTHYMPESKTLLRLLMMPLYLLSGVIFPATNLPQSLLPYLLWNPLLHAIEILRGAFFYQYNSVSGLSPLYVLLSTLALLAFGYTWYWNRRLDLLAR